MKAVISLKGKQYLVSEGEEILTEKIDAKGKKIEIPDVLLVINNNKVIVGKPIVKNAKVQAEILETKKGKKIRILKFKSKKRYKKTLGHRQFISKLKIVKIEVK